MAFAATGPLPHPGAAGGRLVLVDSPMRSMPPRLMLAPRGARLPPGVREVTPVLVVAARPSQARGGCSSAAAAAHAGRPVAAVSSPCLLNGAAFAAAGEGYMLGGSPATGARRVATATAVSGPSGLGLGGAGSSMAGEGHMPGLPAAATRGGGASSAIRARVVAAGACLSGGAGPTAGESEIRHRSALGAHVTASGLFVGGTGAIARFAAASPTPGGGRAAPSHVTRALDMGDDGGGEEDPSDEINYQHAQRQMQAVVYLVCLRRRNGLAFYICKGLLPSGRECRLVLGQIGDVDPTTPVYHWVISRCHDRLREVLGADLYQEIIVARPKDEEDGFKWIVQTDSAIIVSITTLMAEIQYSVMHTETWRAAVREHPLYDMCPLFLNKLARSAAEFSTNVDLACFKRLKKTSRGTKFNLGPSLRSSRGWWRTMLWQSCTSTRLYEVLSSGEQADDPEKTKELLMHYDFLFVQDIHPQDYISGVGSADTKELLFLLKILRPEIRAFRGTWM
ncbi:hypothetical protein ACP4OV_023410 [Aristida adscensionis]